MAGSGRLLRFIFLLAAGCGSDGHLSGHLEARSAEIGSCTDGALLTSPAGVFCLDLRALDVTPVDFDWPGNLTCDLAFASDAVLYVYDCFFAHDLYAIDLTTGAISNPVPVWPLVGFGAMPDGNLLTLGQTDFDRDTVYVLDPTSGAATAMARLPGFTIDGDVVVHDDGFAYWAASDVEDERSHALLRVDLQTWEIFEVGGLGEQWVAGLFSVDGRLIGVTERGSVLEIDPDTASSSELVRFGYMWWGATSTPWWSL